MIRCLGRNHGAGALFFLAILLMMSGPAMAGTSYEVYFGEGPLPPLPETRVSLDMGEEQEEDEAFQVAESLPAAVTEASVKKPLPTWKISDWRRQLEADVQRLEELAAKLADRYDSVERGNFPVAVRHVRASYEAVAELERLGHQARKVFAEAYPLVRNDETAVHPPGEVRRTRLFRERAESIFSGAERFLQRAVERGDSEVVRLEEDEH